MKEYLRPPSPIYEQSNITVHHIGVDNFSIVRRESQNLTRIRKEGIFIIVIIHP